MIEQTAVVIRVEGRFALIEAQRESSCGQCSAQKGCGAGILEHSLGRRVMQLKAVNQCDARAGDQVVVAIPEKGFVKSAFFTYLLPLLLMLLGAVFAQQLGILRGWANQDILALLGAAIGFGLALLLLYRYSQNLEKNVQLQPVVIRKATPSLIVKFDPPKTTQHTF